MGETITANLWFCGWRAGERLQKRGVAGKNKKRKKRERERERERKMSRVSFLLVPRNEGKSLLTLSKIRARYLLQLARSLHTRARARAFATNLSLSTAENQHYYHHYHHRSIEEHEGGSDVFFPKHTLMCPPCSNILKNTAWKPKECAASTPLTLSW